LARPLQVSDLPPLDEWLKGRKVLTVAQDGSGQFKSIQAALDALQPGEAVEVLDRGPYRETLSLNAPDDSGLISRHGTSLEITGRRKPAEPHDPGGEMHYFMVENRFRVHGLRFLAADVKPNDDSRHVMMLGFGGEVAVENCEFRGGHADRGALLAFPMDHGIKRPACIVRECVFHARLLMNMTVPGEQRPLLVVERCWFRGRSHPWAMYLQFQLRGAIRNNVVEGNLESAIYLQDPSGSGPLEISNNTFLTGGIRVTGGDGKLPVMLHNNVLGGSVAVRGERVAELSAALAQWQVGGNTYVSEPNGPGVLPMGPTDRAGEPWFLAIDSAMPGYLRFAAEAPEASRGTGGDWPGYVGAFAPGPPADGDWFTQLRNFWGADLARQKSPD
jgi:hypothetical protein